MVFCRTVTFGWQVPAILLAMGLLLPSCSTAPQAELAPSQRLASMGDFGSQEHHNGVSIYSASALAFQRDASDQTIRRLKGLGANAVALVVSAYQKTADSDEIQPVEGKFFSAAQDEALGHGMDEAHQNGLRVMLKPHLEIRDGTYRGNIGASPAWFKNYSAFILHFASLAEKHGAELFCIGTELENISYSGWQKEWEELIAGVRNVYKGKITYAANWTEYETVCFWGKVDFIGIDSYFPLTDRADPTQGELDQGWQKVADKIAAWRTQQKIEKPVIFTEIGYQSADKTNITPWQTMTRQEDQDEQAMALEALFRTMWGREWFKGLYYWRYNPNEVTLRLDFTIKGKKAEEVLKKWYEKENQS